MISISGFVLVLGVFTLLVSCERSEPNDLPLEKEKIILGDTGKEISVLDYDLESHPEDDRIILNQGTSLGRINDESWIAFKEFSFGSGVSDFSVSAASRNRGGYVEVRIGAPDGELLTSVTIEDTKSWHDFVLFNSEISKEISGVHDLYLVFKGDNKVGLFDIVSFQFN